MAASLSSYAAAMRCPVLRSRVLLVGESVTVALRPVTESGSFNIPLKRPWTHYFAIPNLPEVVPIRGTRKWYGDGDIGTKRGWHTQFLREYRGLLYWRISRSTDAAPGTRFVRTRRSQYWRKENSRGRERKLICSGILLRPSILRVFYAVSGAGTDLSSYGLAAVLKPVVMPLHQAIICNGRGLFRGFAGENCKAGPARGGNQSVYMAEEVRFRVTLSFSRHVAPIT
eukprot:1432108-Rhodomonas_salina.3